MGRLRSIGATLGVAVTPGVDVGVDVAGWVRVSDAAHQNWEIGLSPEFCRHSDDFSQLIHALRDADTIY